MITGREHQHEFFRQHVQVLADEIMEYGDEFSEARVRSWAETEQSVPEDVCEWLDSQMLLLGQHFELVHATGSRVICPGAHEIDADFDFIVFRGTYLADMTRREFEEDMSFAGYNMTEGGSSIPEDNECWYLPMPSMDHDGCKWKINLIEVLSQQTYNDWVAATEICTLLRVTDKSIRKAIFHAVRGTGGHMRMLHQCDADFVNQSLMLHYWR